MEKIIFFGLAIPILGFVFYLGGSAIMNGFKAKVEFAPKKNNEDITKQTELDDKTTNQASGNENLSSELIKLNGLLKDGVLTQEEFEKAKNKLLKD
jgi:hypothetical protein